MKLGPEQIERFDRDGYLFFPSLFTTEEIGRLNAELPAVFAEHRPETVREKGSDAVRTAFAVHMYSEPFARLARHPRMIEPITQLFGEGVYMHQFKVNGKMAFDGDVWQWHQDYGTWTNDDQMPEARAMNVAIFLDEVNEFNGSCSSRAATSSACSRPATTRERPAIRCGPSTTRPSPSWSRAAGWWRPRDRRAR
jgi:L-proline 4-hydroxylase